VRYRMKITSCCGAQRATAAERPTSSTAASVT